MDNFICVVSPQLFQYDTKKSLTWGELGKKIKRNKGVTNLRRTFNREKTEIEETLCSKGYGDVDSYLGTWGGMNIYLKSE